MGFCVGRRDGDVPGWKVAGGPEYKGQQWVNQGASSWL